MCYSEQLANSTDFQACCKPLPMSWAGRGKVPFCLWKIQSRFRPPLGFSQRLLILMFSLQCVVTKSFWSDKNPGLPVCLVHLHHAFLWRISGWCVWLPLLSVPPTTLPGRLRESEGPELSWQNGVLNLALTDPIPALTTGQVSCLSLPHCTNSHWPGSGL